MWCGRSWGCWCWCCVCGDRMLTFAFVVFLPLQQPFISYAFLPMFLHAPTCRPMSDWVKVEILCWHNACFVKKSKKHKAYRIVSDLLRVLGAVVKRSSDSAAYPGVTPSSPAGAHWTNNKLWKKASVSYVFQYYSKAFQTVKRNNPKTYFRFTSAKQNFQNCGRFLCFSILFESIWNSKNEQS